MNQGRADGGYLMKRLVAILFGLMFTTSLFAKQWHYREDFDSDNPLSDSCLKLNVSPATLQKNCVRKKYYDCKEGVIRYRLHVFAERNSCEARRKQHQQLIRMTASN